MTLQVGLMRMPQVAVIPAGPAPGAGNGICVVGTQWTIR